LGGIVANEPESLLPPMSIDCKSCRWGSFSSIRLAFLMFLPNSSSTWKMRIRISNIRLGRNRLPTVWGGPTLPSVKTDSQKELKEFKKISLGPAVSLSNNTRK